jgi:hypothetical protein
MIPIRLNLFFNLSFECCDNLNNVKNMLKHKYFGHVKKWDIISSVLWKIYVNDQQQQKRFFTINRKNVFVKITAFGENRKEK